jgi:Flp pilus assembly protein TadG
MRRFIKRFRNLLATRDNDGVAALEFALITPVFVLVLAGIVDLGGVVSAKFRLDTAVAAASNYVLVNNSQVSSTQGGTLATNLASIVTGGTGTTMSANVSIVVNNGPSATVVTGGTATSGGTAANANSCYCPTGTPTSLTWGTAVTTCGSTCPSGLLAGKFVLISANYTYLPVFSNYNFINGGTVYSGALVQTQ